MKEYQNMVVLDGVPYFKFPLKMLNIYCVKQNMLDAIDRSITVSEARAETAIGFYDDWDEDQLGERRTLREELELDAILDFKERFLNIFDGMRDYEKSLYEAEFEAAGCLMASEFEGNIKEG